MVQIPGIILPRNYKDDGVSFAKRIMHIDYLRRFVIVPTVVVTEKFMECRQFVLFLKTFLNDKYNNLKVKIKVATLLLLLKYSLNFFLV